MQLFDGRIEGRIVYLDLDTVIVNNIDWLLQYDGDFAYLLKTWGSVNAHRLPERKVSEWCDELGLTGSHWIWNEFSFREDACD